MITIYKDKKDIPIHMEYVEWNDLFFNKNTALKLDGRAAKIIEQIDEAKVISKFQIRSKFHETVVDVDCLSTGCKTVLNVLYFPDKVFCIKECGENALDILYGLESGQVYCDYPTISFDMTQVKTVCQGNTSIISNYEELKEWWMA